MGLMGAFIKGLQRDFFRGGLHREPSTLRTFALNFLQNLHKLGGSIKTRLSRSHD
jgi:hypothetical protein